MKALLEQAIASLEGMVAKQSDLPAELVQALMILIDLLETLQEPEEPG